MSRTILFAFLAVAFMTALVSASAVVVEGHHKKEPNLQFKVCGYYCGPNWCANEVISEQSCVAEGIWGIASAPSNCADSCCRTHDYCCGLGENRPSCNDAIVACIEANRCYLSICGVAVWAAMKAVSTWCCGSACPTYSDPNVELSLVGQSFCHNDVKLSFATDSEYTVESNGVAACAPQRYYLNQTSNDVILGHVPTYASHLLNIHSQDRTMHPDTHLPHNKKCVHAAMDSIKEIESVVYWPTGEVLSVRTSEGKHIKMAKC